MKVVTAFGLGVVALLYALPAEALSITNNDPDATTITVIVGGDSKELTIEPETKVEPDCADGCIIELDSGDQYEMKGGEEATIEGGVLFFDVVPGIDEEEYPDVEVPDPDQPMPEPEAPPEE